MEKVTGLVTVTIAGKSHQLKWDKAALYELGNFPEATADIDENNGAAMWRRACIFAFAMLQGNHGYSSPKAIAAVVDENEVERLMEAITKAITSASEKGKAEDIDPLSRSGPSPETASD